MDGEGGGRPWRAGLEATAASLGSERGPSRGSAGRSRCGSAAGQGGGGIRVAMRAVVGATGGGEDMQELVSELGKAQGGGGAHSDAVGTGSGLGVVRRGRSTTGARWQRWRTASGGRRGEAVASAGRRARERRGEEESGKGGADAGWQGDWVRGAPLPGTMCACVCVQREVGNEGEMGDRSRVCHGGGLSRGEGPVGPVGWPAGSLAQLARGAFCLFFFVCLFSLLYFLSFIYFLFCFILI